MEETHDKPSRSDTKARSSAHHKKKKKTKHVRPARPATTKRQRSLAEASVLADAVDTAPVEIPAPPTAPATNMSALDHCKNMSVLSLGQNAHRTSEGLMARRASQGAMMGMMYPHPGSLLIMNPVVGKILHKSDLAKSGAVEAIQPQPSLTKCYKKA